MNNKTTTRYKEPFVIPTVEYKISRLMSSFSYAKDDDKIELIILTQPRARTYIYMYIFSFHGYDLFKESRQACSI